MRAASLAHQSSASHVWYSGHTSGIFLLANHRSRTAMNPAKNIGRPSNSQSTWASSDGHDMNKGLQFSSAQYTAVCPTKRASSHNHQWREPKNRKLENDVPSSSRCLG